MALTVKGRLLVQQCEPLWSELQATLMSAEAYSSASGIVKIGCGEIAASLWLPALTKAIKHALPNLTLEIDVDLTISLHQKIEAGLLDVALVVGPVDTPLLIANRIAAIEMGWYATEEISRRLDGEADFGEIPLWSLSRPSHQYQLIVESLRNAKLSSRIINTCNNVRTLIDIVASGAGVGVLPSRMLKSQLDRGQLVPISPRLPAYPIEFFAVMRRMENEPIVLDVFRRLQAIWDA